MHTNFGRITGVSVELSGSIIATTIAWPATVDTEAVDTCRFCFAPDQARELGRQLLAMAARGGAAKPYTVEHVGGTGCTVLPNGGVMASFTWLDADGNARAAHHCLTNAQAQAFAETFARVMAAAATWAPPNPTSPN